MIRALLERLSRGRVLRRKLPPAHGGHALYVSPDAAMRLWQRDLGAVDPFLLRMAAGLVRPGMVVWDVGANVGLFAFAAAFAAGPAGRVLAVEADGWLAGLLQRSARSSPRAYARVEVLAAAVADSAGTVELCIAERGRAGNHLRSVAGSTQTGGVREVRQVTAVTLDSLLDRSPAPAVVKIDTEGAELLCLQGPSGSSARSARSYSARSATRTRRRSATSCAAMATRCSTPPPILAARRSTGRRGTRSPSPAHEDRRVASWHTGSSCSPITAAP